MRGKTKSAADRAVERWGLCFLHVRGVVRMGGVRGALPQLDRYVSTARGGGYARFLADVAAHVRDASRGTVSADRLAQELAEFSADVVHAVYAEPPKVA
jgi:hypothetical protein